MRAQYESVDYLLDLSQPMYRASNREAGELGVLAIGRDVLGVLSPSISAAGIVVRCTGDSRLKVRMNEGQLMQVFLALLDNAIHATSSQPSESRQIHLHIIREPEPGFVVADSGPGIPEKTTDAIFKPFYSGRAGGRGLGLFIVRGIMERYDSRVSVDSDGRLLGGAQMRVQFSPGIVVRNAMQRPSDVAEEAV